MMETVSESVKKLWRTTAGLLTMTGVYLLHTLGIRRYKKNDIDLPGGKYQDGVVYLHIFPRRFTKKVINLSPYAIKVETWCRMHNVPYQVVETSQFSKKEGQIPWMMLDGEETADSTTIINKLRARFGVTAAPQNPETRGLQRTLCRMLDDNFSSLYFWYRYHVAFEEFGKYFRIVTAPTFLQNFIRRQIGKNLNKKAYFMGFGRYGLDHSIKLGEQDLQAVSDILGDKPFFLGDTPSDLDCTVFCHLSQILYPDMPYPWKPFILEKCPNLARFCDRVRDRYWSDWDSLVTTGTFQ